MEDTEFSLSLEQELFWISLCQNVDKLKDSDTKALLKNVYKHLLIQEARYKQLLTHRWRMFDELPDELFNTLPEPPYKPTDENETR
jgi:hypothetical protein